MKNTKGFKVCRKIGEILTIAAFMVTIIVGCSSIADLPDKEFYLACAVYVAIMVVCVVGGYFLTDIRRFYRIMYPVSIVVGAWMYSALDRASKPFRKCNSIKEKCGSYIDTYYTCQEIFDGRYDRCR